MSVAAAMLRTRWLVRAPIWLFRARLGFLFGGRLLLLEHVGRTSGEPRYVVLETVERPDAARVIVASGFGERAQWFRNLQAEPACHVSIGFGHRMAATASRLGEDETAVVLSRYRVAHPRAYAELSGVIEESTGLPIDAVPMMQLRLDG
ncbi:nitroreductase family deazaflavin-dependent oxidoreductase [Gordonia sp. CPCC 206044]|uniref:nitroreductase family deazaflavin-dependent oxidoreductase n=1 Tax=Gordonia sp. CPCC 206044 TaxID=3140793 RepID=UPI003AF3FAB1